MTECGEDDALLTSMKMGSQFQAQAALSSCLPASRLSGPRVVAGTVYMKNRLHLPGIEPYFSPELTVT